ncbi:hypothetical protein [Rhizobium sp. 1399]|uniref:hypothetical protein n=1 Tax=Rhizobium sp. 1399 TaxID=2817758 RepID=UPI00285C555B|nr:hypothetical protein [Rhizobium sp. 1399]MDR6671247.1 DNA-binding IscR family transcriptional regulator [Rhizobium sp. 1399]
MDVNSREELPVQLAPVYYQYAVDKIVCSRGPNDTQSKAIKCVGLYSVIVRMAAEDRELTHAKIAERIGTTYPGLLKPLEYLKRLQLVAAVRQKVPGTQINVQHILVPRPLIENVRRDLKRAANLPPDEDLTEFGLVVPRPWHDTVNHVLDYRDEGDTTGRALKALGLIPFMARLAADGLPVTRPVLSRKLGIAENTLAPLISLLEARNLVEIEERRIPGHIGTEYAIHIPSAIVERVRRAVRRLEKEGSIRNWPNSVRNRTLAREVHQKLAEDYGRRFAP